jgi:hypothetical protein
LYGQIGHAGLSVALTAGAVPTFVLGA